MSSHVHQIACTIAQDASLSAAVFIGGEFSLIGIQYPAAWDAAGLTFQVSFDGVTYRNLLDDSGTEVALTVTTSQFRELNSADFKTAIYLKLRSGTAALPVAQTAARSITIWTRRYIAR